jgi:hypothetical protein
LGYVDCSSHPEETPVFSKPRQSGSVAVTPCGERFTVLLKGFIFSRVETKDGKIGYVLTNVISLVADGAAPSRTGNSQVATVLASPTPVDASRPAVVSAAVTAPAPEQPGPLSLTPPPAANTSNAPEPTPAHTEASQPQPEAARPEPRPVRGASVHSSWERPLPSARHNSRLELYSGYSYASNNLNGVMGSFGYNVKPWLQIAGDSSYDIVTMNGVKNVLYANHYGGRFYYRHRGWGFTPFVEGLVGGSRLDTSGGGVKTSSNGLSYKAGGGIDIRVSRHWEIRAVNVDYYHSAFGTNAAQNNNYWASAGVVLRLFGSATGE